MPRHAFECTHIVQPVGQLYENHPYIIRKGEEHLSEIFRLLGSAVIKNAGNFCETVNDFGYLFAKMPFDIFNFQLCIFYHIMQQSCDDRGGTQSDLLHTNLGYCKRVKDIGLTRPPSHIFMRLLRHVKGPFDDFGVIVFEERLRMPQQFAVSSYDLFLLLFQLLLL